jgi:hypothetical protein
MIKLGSKGQEHKFWDDGFFFANIIIKSESVHQKLF